MHKVEKFFIGLSASMLLLWMISLISYIANIVQLVLLATATTTGNFTLLVTLKIVGIVLPPLGVVLGIVGMF